MSQTMSAVRLHAPEDLRLDTVPVPVPAHGEVLVKVWRSGICGTDLHIAKGNFPAPNLPLTLGHEFSGVITEVGDGVDSLSSGAHVVVDINIACGHCYFCRRGQKLFCPQVEQLGVHRAGGLAEYVVGPRLQRARAALDPLARRRGLRRAARLRDPRAGPHRHPFG